MGKLIPSYSEQQLIEVGKFSSADLLKIKSYRGHHNRLGFAYQLIFVRVFNFFPRQKPLEIIDEILTFAALQLDSNKKHLGEYCKYQQHIARHQDNISTYLNLLPFDDHHSKVLGGYLFNEAQRIDQAAFLLSAAKYFLKNHRILQPVDSTLQRLIIRERERAREFIFSKLVGSLNEKIIQKLDDLLIVEKTRISKLQYWNVHEITWTIEELPIGKSKFIGILYHSKIPKGKDKWNLTKKR